MVTFFKDFRCVVVKLLLLTRKYVSKIYSLNFFGAKLSCNFNTQKLLADKKYYNLFCVILSISQTIVQIKITK